MHFEILTEDQSSGKAIEVLFPKLLGNDVTFRVHPYKGMGRIPHGLRAGSDPSKRMLLNQLPRILNGYGNTPYSGIVLIICDLDDRDKQAFTTELQQVLENCNKKPETLFCLAIEEFEAWYLGDLEAIRKAYPRAKNNVLNRYENDSICGTWELLADAIYAGGHNALTKKGWQAVGEQKSKWANTISPHMVVEENLSPSFKDMYSQLRNLSA